MAKKLKTKKAAKKRFEVTSTGKILRRQIGKVHILEHKTSGSKRNKRKSQEISSSDNKRVKSLLGI